MFALSAASLLRRWFTGEEHIDKSFYQVKNDNRAGARNLINFSRPLLLTQKLITAHLNMSEFGYL